MSWLFSGAATRHCPAKPLSCHWECGRCPSMVDGQRRGQAVAAVIIMCTVLISLVGVLFFATGSQRHTHDLIVRQAKAQLAASVAVQTALYKYRVLPHEFYRYQEALSPSSTDPLNPLIIQSWMLDLKSSNPGVMASFALRLQELDDRNGTFSMEVDKCDLISKSDTGYRQDFLRIQAWGEYNGERKNIEEFVHIQVSHDQ